MIEHITFPYIHGEENREPQVSIVDSNAKCKHRREQKNFHKYTPIVVVISKPTLYLYPSLFIVQIKGRA